MSKWFTVVEKVGKIGDDRLKTGMAEVKGKPGFFTRIVYECPQGYCWTSHLSCGAALLEKAKESLEGIQGSGGEGVLIEYQAPFIDTYLACKIHFEGYKLRN